MAGGTWVAPWGGSAWAANRHGGGFKKGPYLQNVTRDAITIMWESDAAVPGRVVVHSSVEPDHVAESPAARMHEVRIEGLQSGRRYFYTVTMGEGATAQVATGELATAPGPDEAFSFVVFGDSRSNANAHMNVVERVRREVPDFILGTGDMVNEGSVESDWQIFFDVERELLRENVMFPSLGNHDREPRPARSATNYRKYFSLPENSPQPERYYAFTYGNARFLVLDSNSYSFALTDETSWLETQLRSARGDDQIRHIFVSMHHPPYSTAIHGGQTELREVWTPLYEKYGVDAVFSGHDHDYERAEMNGIRYFVSGGGGAPVYPKDPHPSKQDAEASIYFERTFNYLRVQIVGDFVEVAGVRDDGTLIESTSWGAMPARVAAAPAPPPTPLPMASAMGATLPVTTAPSRSSSSGCMVAQGAQGDGQSAAWQLLLLASGLVIARRRR